MEIIFLIAVFQSLFFFILLSAKENKRTDDKILTFLFLLLAVYLSPFYFIYEEGKIMNIGLVILFQPLTLLAGPLLYIYYETLINAYQKLKISYIWHFIPFVLNCLELPFFLSREETLTLPYYAGFWFTKYEMIMRFISVPIYMTYILIKSYRLKRGIDTNREDMFDNFSWIRIICFGILSVCAIAFISLSIELFMKIDLPYFYDYYILTAVSVFIFYLGFMGFKQRNMLSNHAILTKNEKEIVAKKSKIYLKYNNLDFYAKRLYYLMENEKIYLNPDVSLTILADKLEIPPHIVSLLLKEKIKKKFTDFINEYRIEEFKKQLSSPSNQKYNIMALAYDAGFNSKATFNRIFKSYTGKTPAEYKLKEVC